MPQVDRHLLLPYRAQDMYNLVRDVRAYPQFLPWCPSTQVWEQSDPLVIEARVDIAFLGIRSHFRTRNTHVEAQSIVLELVDGPFRHLRGSWQFRPLGDQACKVSVALDYHFAAGLLGRAIAPVFGKIAESLIDAFAERAEVLFGSDGAASGLVP
jgi:ribosome-associated toxin RatA of RatAB toxin-antitoxin module